MITTGGATIGLAGSDAAVPLGAATAGVCGPGDDAEGATGGAAPAAAGGGVFGAGAPGGDCFTPPQPAVTSRQSSPAVAARPNCDRELTAILLSRTRVTISLSLPAGRHCVEVWSCLPPGVETRVTVRPIVVGSSLRARSPSETMPTSRLSALTTGKRRTCALPMFRDTSSRSSVSKQ